jgi:hypothetical protein
MVFCTKCGTQHQEDDNFCKKCGSPLPKASSTGGEKIINIPRYLAKRCLMENLDNYREHHEWRMKTYGLSGYNVPLRKRVWIQFDPATEVCARLPATVSETLMDEDLSQLKPGWHYFRIFTPTKEWEVEAYLDSPPGLELTDGEYKGRFV